MLVSDDKCWRQQDSRGFSRDLYIFGSSVGKHGNIITHIIFPWGKVQLYAKFHYFEICVRDLYIFGYSEGKV